MDHSTFASTLLTNSSSPGDPGGVVAPAAGSAGQAPALRARAGCSSNTNLPTFAREAGLAHLEALNPGSTSFALHLGFDTVEWNLAVTNELLEVVVPAVASLVGAGEQADKCYSFVVSRVGGFAYRFKMAFSAGFDVYLPDEGFARYGLRVVAHSKPCLVSEDLTADALAVLSYVIGLDAEQLAPQLSLSRNDVCLDVLMPEPEFQKLCGQVAGRSPFVVTRARHLASYVDGGRFTGFSVGKNEIKLRLYDKRLEAVKGGDWPLWATVYGRGEPFEVPEGYTVARFEFQLRRGFLAECCAHGVDQHDNCAGLRTLDEFRAASADVLTYLTGDWFRLAGAARGKDHARPMRPLWRAIQAGFLSSAWSSFSGHFRRRLRRFVSTNVELLKEMAAGCLATIAAAEGHLAGFGRALSPAIALKLLGRHIERDTEKWSAGRDRRFKALAYGSKNWRAVAV